MNKNTFLNNKLLSKSNIAIFLAILSVLGFLVSRPLNSVATILFGINALWGINPKQWLKQKWWWICVLWVASYAITYFWTTDMHSWHERIDVKLAFLLLPISFALLPRFSIKQFTILTFALAILFLAGAGYSISFLVRSYHYYIDKYWFSAVLPTPVENDHICFSVAIALFVVWSVYFFPYLKGRVAKVLLALTIAILSIYLHILSAKSGLLAWYVFIVMWLFYMVIKKNRLLGLGMIIMFSAFSYFAWNYIPTLRQKVGYVRYSIEMYEQGERTGNFSDVGRIISDDIAVKIIKEHPFTGVGAGDILEEMDKGYDRWYPQVKKENRLFPHNQFLSAAVGCGVLSLIVLLVLVIYPMFSINKNRQGFFATIVSLMLLIPLLAEPFLEIQFGVFVYLFFLLWIWCVPIQPQVQE